MCVLRNIAKYIHVFGYSSTDTGSTSEENLTIKDPISKEPAKVW